MYSKKSQEYIELTLSSLNTEILAGLKQFFNTRTSTELPLILIPTPWCTSSTSLVYFISLLRCTLPHPSSQSVSHSPPYSPSTSALPPSLIENPLEILQLSALDWNASHRIASRRVVLPVRNGAFIVGLLRRFIHFVILIDDWLNVTFCSTPSNDKLIKTGDFVYSLAPAAVFFGSVV